MKIYFFLLLTFFANQNLYSQNLSNCTDSLNTISSFEDDITSVYFTGRKLISAPTEFDKTDWITLGSVVALTSTAFLLDDENRNFWKKNKNNISDKISEVGRIYGEISYAAILSGSLYLGGKLFCDKEISTTGKLLLKGLFYAGLTTTVIKVTTGRSRPYLNEGDFKFRFFNIKNDHNSFPSGHVTVAFTLSTILSERFDNTYATIALYTLASSTVWQRMYSDNHWLSDTILAASIGYFIGKAVVKYEGQSDNNERKSLTLSPAYINGNISLNLNYSF